MDWEYFDHDPITGLTEYYSYDPITDRIAIKAVQDVEPVVDFCKAMVNQQIGDKNFRGEGWLYAALPMSIVGQLMQKGINIMDSNDNKRLLEEINTNYPYFKTTHRHHAVK
jgi:tetrahydromethanopterin S-methyltransferase subunit G